MSREGRRPALRFPLLILLLIAFSLTLFVGYAIYLTQHPVWGAAPAVPHPPMSPPSRTDSASPLPLPQLPSPENIFALLHNRTIERDDNAHPVRLAYDPDPTPDPRGKPLDRLPQPARIDSKSGFIWTQDRRTLRIAPMIPRLNDPDFTSPREDEEHGKDWEIVIGIPSIDTDKGARRRNYQRGSWLRYANVGRTVLVKYLLAHHPRTGYDISPELRKESRETHDIIFFEMKEGVWNSEKKSWAVEVGMSRKAYAWYCYVADTYKARFVMKGDDDEFVRTVMLQNELLALPFTQRVYYGRVMHWGVKKGSNQKFPFSGGMSITMSFDLVDWIRDSRIAEEGVDYYHEDVMVGRWFYYANIQLNVVRDCRHHDVHHGANKQKQNDASLCIHHLKDTAQEYLDNFKRYPDTSLPPPKRRPSSAASRDSVGNSFLDIGGSCKK